MSPINLESEVERAHNTTPLPAEYAAPLESNNELDEFLTLSRQLSEKQRQRLTDILRKSESEKALAYRTLDLIRRQLNNLENSASSTTLVGNDGDAVDADIVPTSETEQIAKILEGVRNRMHILNESTSDLRSRIQKLEELKNELAKRSTESEELEEVTESHVETNV